MKCAIAMTAVALAFPGAASATTTSAFTSSNGTLSVELTGDSASANVGCSSTGDVLVGGGNPGTGVVSCASVKAISVTGDAGQDAVSLAGVTAAKFTSLVAVTASLGAGNDNYFGSAIGDTVNMGAADSVGGDVVSPGSGNDHISCPGGCQVTENLTASATLSNTTSSNPGGVGGTDSLSGMTALTTVSTGNDVNVDASAVTVPILFDGYGDSTGQDFHGGSADDTFNISGGSAAIDGGGGVNELMITPNTGSNVTLTPTSLSASVQATLQNIQSASITGDANSDVDDWSTFAGPVTFSDTSGRASVTAGPGDDSIALFGGSGSVNAGGGDDQIYLSGDPSASYSVDGGSGTNRLTWVESASGTINASDSALSTPDGAISMANIGALTLNGTFGNDVFDARAFSGPVTIAGEGGQDVMLGGVGADSFTGFSDSTDCFNGGPGADTIDGGGSTTDTDVIDPADTLVSGSTYAPVSSCGYGDGAPTTAGSGGGGSGGGGGAGGGGSGGSSAPTDTTPPTVTAKVVAWGSEFSASSFGDYATVQGIASDPAPSSGAPTVRCSLDPTSVPTGYDDLSAGACTQQTTTVGPHTFYVAARDPAGNTSTVASVSFQIIAVPDTLITSGSGDVWTTLPPFTFTSTIPGSTFKCSVDGGPFTACTSPHTLGRFAANSTHTFSVQATSPAGVTDPTPDSANVHINATQVSSQPCEITPFTAVDPYSMSGLDACAFYFHVTGTPSCPSQEKCFYPPQTCPALASCTLSTRATWVDGDGNVAWTVDANSDLGGYAGGSSSGGGFTHNCTTGGARPNCAVTDTGTAFGPAIFNGFCDAVDVDGSAAESDAAAQNRDLMCTVSETITPGTPLDFLTRPGGILVLAGGSGSFVFTPETVSSHRAAARAVKKKKAVPLFKTATKRATKAGAVSFLPTLSTAGKAALKLHGRLALAIRMRFTPTGGGAVQTRAIRTTLRVTAKSPPRCPTHKPRKKVKLKLCVRAEPR